MRKLARERGEVELGERLIKLFVLLYTAVSKEVWDAMGQENKDMTLKERMERFPEFMADEPLLYYGKEGLEKVLKERQESARKEGLNEGLNEGLKEGRSEGRKDLLLFLCRDRYGKECESALAKLLESEDSPARLNEISQRLLNSDNADDFLAQVRSA